MGKDGVRTVDDWRDQFRHESKSKRGQWRILSLEMFYSEAWQALNKAGTTAVLLMPSKLEFVKKGTKDRKGVTSSVSTLKNGGQFSMTITELQALGLSASTATRARIQAWQTGFFDVVSPGTVHHAGKYRYSERWKLYPTGEYRPTNQQPPGVNVYPRYGFKRKESGRMDDSSPHVNFDLVPHVNFDVM